MDGPVANKSFIADASYQLKVIAAWVKDLRDYHHEDTKSTKLFLRALRVFVVKKDF